MSLNALTTLAVERDAGKPQRLVAPAQRKANQNAVKEQESSYTEVLVKAIPTEVLALYTFLVTEIVGTIVAGQSQRLTLRWLCYGAGIVAIIVYLVVSYARNKSTSKNRKFPGTEIVSASVAFAAWGLVMPGSPLLSELSSSNARIWTAIITVAGVFVVGLVTGSLTKPAKNAKIGWGPVNVPPADHDLWLPSWSGSSSDGQLRG